LRHSHLDLAGTRVFQDVARQLGDRRRHHCLIAGRETQPGGEFASALSRGDDAVAEEIAMAAAGHGRALDQASLTCLPTHPSVE
jgi:hypothetical protein